MKELLVTTREAARRLGICRSTLFKLLKDERLKAVRLGGKVLVPTRELARYVETLPLRNGGKGAA